MKSPTPTLTATFRVLAACFLIASPCLHAAEEDATSSLVLRTGRSIPLSAVAFEKGAFVVKTAVGPIQAGQTFSLAAISHVSHRPAEIDQALALLLMDQPAEAATLLEPVLTLHKVSTEVPENFWIEAARVELLAFALKGDSSKVGNLRKEIEAAANGRHKEDPHIALAQILSKSKPLMGNDEERIAALGALISDLQPDDVNALASFFKAKFLLGDKQPKLALDAWLAIGSLYPAGGLPIVSAAELHAALLLAELDHREEAVRLLGSAIQGGKGGPIAGKAAERLEVIK